MPRAHAVQTSPLFYDVSRCAIGPERLQAETPLENILSPADAADGVKTIISFSLPWYRLSRPRISPFLGEEPCARPTQVRVGVTRLRLRGACVQLVLSDGDRIARMLVHTTL